MDELIFRLSSCVCELDEIADELELELDIDAMQIHRASDIVDDFQRKLSAMLDREDNIPDIYHIKLQERLDEGDWE